MNGDVLSFLESPRQDAEFVVSHRRRSVRSWSEEYNSRMWEMEADLLRIAIACGRSVTIGPSTTKCLNAGSRVCAARTFQKGEVIGSYYGALVNHDLSSREHTRKLYGNKVLKVDVAQFSRYALQVQVQRRRL